MPEPVYLSGERIQGRSDDTVPATIAQTSWKELGRSTLGSAGDVLDSGTIAAKDNLMILVIGYKSGTASTEKLQFNADTGSNYAERHSENSGTDNTNTSQDHIELSVSGTEDEFTIATIRNIANKEKLVIAHTTAAGSAGVNNGNRFELVGKWANTSDQITRIQITNPYGGDLDTGSELVVLGCDDDEADSGTNFWQELGKGTTASDLNTGTITAKKYLMVQTHVNMSSNAAVGLQFNTDSGASYAARMAEDFDSNQTYNPSGFLPIGRAGSSNDPDLTVSYIVNVSNKEKLCLSENSSNKVGTGAGNAPKTQQTGGKWTNTSSQITKISIKDTQGINNNSWTSGSEVRVWGSN